MRALTIGLSAVLLAGPAAAQTYVHGYTTKNGTYVAPHYRSSPNSTTTDNWSVKPNVNPYTGQAGTRNPYPSYSSPYRPTFTPQTPAYSCTYCSQPSQSSTDDDGSSQ